MSTNNLKPGLYITNGTKTMPLGNAAHSSFKAALSFDDFFADDSMSSTGAESLAATVGYIYACYRYRSDKLMGLPREITRSGEPVKECDLPFEIDLGDLLWRTEYSLNVYAAAYWYRLKTSLKLKGVRWFDPTTITPKVNDSGLYKFRRQLSGTHYDYPVKDGLSDVIWFWLPSLREAAPGVAISDTVSLAGQVLRSIDTFADKFFDQGAMPLSLIIVPPGTRNDDKRELENRFRRTMSGIKNAFRPVAVRSNVEVRQIGAPPADLAMTDLSDSKRAEIFAVTGVPPSLVLANAANYASAERVALIFFEGTMTPRARIIEEAINRQLFRPLGYELTFHPEQLPVMKRDEKESASALLDLRQAGMPLPIALRVMGYELEDDEQRIVDAIDTEPTPPTTPVPDMQPEEDEAAKAADLSRWKRKAKKAIKTSGLGAVDFDSHHIVLSLHAVISLALKSSTTSEEVETAFDAAPFLVYASQSYP